MIELPLGFGAHVANIGVKDDTDDLVVIAAEQPVAAAGVFTRSRFAGPSVRLSRAHLANLTAQAVVVLSKNANVANGAIGDDDARTVITDVAGRLGCDPDNIVLASTGVIGRRYPIERVRAGLTRVPQRPSSRAADAAAAAMMTTDTHPKVAAAVVEGSNARVVGIAKGVGMIEPDMATMIAVILTDAEVERSELDELFRNAVDRSFNCVSIDGDTSTSDTAVVLASGDAGPVGRGALASAFDEVCVSLTRMIAADGEGAETLIEVVVDQSSSVEQARRVAKSIVNSPLVKTAVHGADPNWGRVAMAVGKCSDDTDIDPDRVVIRFGTSEVYPTRLDDDDLAALSSYMAGDEVLIHVTLQTGSASATAWGCDLTDGYVRINADYTT